MQELEYGKRITESYHQGELTVTRVSYSIPSVITDRKQVISEIMKALDLITEGQTCEVKLVIEGNKQHEVKKITRDYTLIKNG